LSTGVAPGSEAPRGAFDAGRMRTFLLALVGLGAAGLLLELLLLEHWMARPQYVPLVVLSLTLVAVAVLALRPGSGTVRLFRGVMGLVVVAGLAGIGFHLSDNLAFERELTPGASLGLQLWEAVRGATPLLAPGSLVQLGLVGLVLTWRHPALRTDTVPASAGHSFEPTEHP